MTESQATEPVKKIKSVQFDQDEIRDINELRAMLPKGKTFSRAARLAIKHGLPIALRQLESGAVPVA